MRDITLEDTFRFDFTTRAFATGIPTALAGTPALSVHEEGNDTLITAGVSLDVSVGAAPVVGLNEGTIVAAAANGYENGKSYSVFISAGTVGGVSVVGEKVHEFTIGLSAAVVDLAKLTAALGAEPADANLLAQFQKLAAVVEHQRAEHTHQPTGRIIFVDPSTGDTHANGNRGGISDPYSLVQDAHDNAVTDSNHDMIILLAGAAAGATTLTEDVTLTKRYLQIRGPGRDFIWTRSGAGNTITITADGIGLEGFQLTTAAVGAGHGCAVNSADFFKARGLWINNTQGDAIALDDCDNYVIKSCHLQATGQSGSGHGITVNADIGETCNYGVIKDCHIHDVQGDGIQFTTSGGGTIDECAIQHNTISDCTDDGIDLTDAGSNKTIISDNRFGNNATDIEDAGTSTILLNNEQWCTSVQVGVAGVNLTNLGGMSAGMMSEVLVEVNNALDTAISELGVGAPSATPSIRTGLMLLYMTLRNRTVVQTSGVDALEIYNNAGTLIASKLLTDDGSDYNEAQMA